MWQKMRKSELYSLLNKITVKFMNKESPTVKEIRRLEKLTNEDLLIMEDEEMESYDKIFIIKKHLYKNM